MHAAILRYIVPYLGPTILVALMGNTFNKATDGVTSMLDPVWQILGWDPDGEEGGRAWMTTFTILVLVVCGVWIKVFRK